MSDSELRSQPMYEVGDAVRVVDPGCYAVIQKVHTSIRSLPRYDVLCDDGDRLPYQIEYNLYPSKLETFYAEAQRLSEDQGLRLGSEAGGPGDSSPSGPQAA